MIPVLERLIRLKKQEVDVQRLVLTELEERLNRIHEEIQTTRERVLMESHLVRDSVELSHHFQHYADAMETQVKRLHVVYENIDLLRRTELSKLEQLFGELKTLETILDKKLITAARDLSLKEQKEWDDTAMIAQNKRNRNKQH
jgi:hypothetical protein